MTFLDFFSGIGTIRIGMEQAGHECVGHVEWDKFAQQSYMAMHEVKEDEYIGWDICAERADELPRADCWWFGAPCQDFSIAGKRKGMGGERSSLVNEIFRLIEETPEENRPTWLFYENVKGMLSSNGGWDFLGILLEMDRLGYDVEWQLLNSKHFGVPQNRDRVFTIGHLRGRCARKVFPIGESNGTADELQGQHVGTLTTRTGESSTVGTYIIEGERVSQKVVGFDRKNGRRFKEDGDPMFTLTAQDRHGVAIMRPKRTDYGKQIRKQYEAGEVEESRHNMTTLEPVFDGISNTITTVQKDNLLLDNRECVRIRKGEPKVIDDQGRVKDSYKQHDIVPTLRAQTHGNPPKLVNGFRIRKLTPKECWRLQGISDDYFERAKASGVSDSQLYKQAGNACTVNVIYEIAKRLGEEQ